MFKRLRVIIKAKLSRIFDRFEDPGELLDYSYTRQVEQLAGLRRAVADLVTAKKRIQRERENRQGDLSRLDSGARQALAAGDERLARRVLERKQFISDELAGLDQQVSQLESQQAQMVASERAIRAKIERFRSQKEATKAQYSAARASVAVSEAAAGLSAEFADISLATGRILDKVETMQARAGAMEELERAGTFGVLDAGEADIDRQIRELTSGAGVEAELQKLKMELNPGLADARHAELQASGELDDPPAHRQ
jgi:phage shock protein A